jgi:nicotinamide-nucleotide amidase
MDDRLIEAAEAVAERLGDRTLASAESCTAGRITAAMACVERATTFLRGGLVSYQSEVKGSLLGVTTESVLCEEAARQMADGACKLLGSSVAVSTTGLAGGEPEDGVPVGTVFIATSVDGHTTSRTHHFDGDPETVCAAATRQALLDLCQALD